MVDEAPEVGICVNDGIAATMQEPSSDPIRLGTVCNLLRGFNIGFDVNGGATPPLYEPDRTDGISPRALMPPPADVSFETGYTITFHYGIDDLIGAFYRKWDFGADVDGADPIPLALGYPIDSTKRVRFAQWLGIEEEDAAPGKAAAFAMVRKKKLSQTGAWTPQSEKDLHADLEADLAASPDDPATVTPLLDLFTTWGTHYVSSLSVGDEIVQIFVYDPDKLEKVESEFPESARSGPLSGTFQQYTQPGEFGYTRYAGKILPLSADRAFDVIRADLNDDIFKVRESIFRFNDRAVFAKLDALTATLPIAFTLEPLAGFLGTGRQEHQWHSVLNNALLLNFGQLFGSTLALPSVTHDYRTLYKSFHLPLPTTFSTSVMTISSPHVDLAQIKTLNPENVNKLLVFADVVELTGNANLPGDKVEIYCREFRTGNGQHGAHELQLNEKGYDMLQLYSREFHGSLLVRCPQTSKRTLVLNGQALLPDAGNTGSRSGASHLGDPPEAAVDAQPQRMAFAMNLPVLAARSLIHYPISKEATPVGTAATEWIGGMCRQSMDNGLLELGIQTLSTLKAGTPGPDDPLNVPYQSYPAYQPLVDSLVSAIDGFNTKLENYTTTLEIRKAAEQTAQSLEQLNENIQAVGTFLVAQNDAFAAKETDVANFKQAILDKKQSALTKANADQLEMGDKLDSQLDVVRKSTRKMKREIANYLEQEGIQLALDLAIMAADTYDAVATIKELKNAKKEAKEVANTSKKIKEYIRLMKVMSDMVRSARNWDKNLQSRKNSIDALNERAGKDIPTKEEWNEYETNLYYGIAPLASVIPYANTYIRNIKILAERGRAFVEIGAKIMQLEYDIFISREEKKIAQSQADRLKALDKTVKQPDLEPDEAAQIDLFQAGSVLQARIQALSLDLVRTLGLQDAALQYYYLQSPAVIQNYDILSLKETLVSQQENSIQALENFNPRPADFKQPVVVSVRGVPVDRFGAPSGASTGEAQELMSREAYLGVLDQGVALTVPLDHPDFLNYVRVRINEIEVAIDGIASTGSGKVDVQLVNYAQPFMDRGLAREPLKFTTVRQEFAYVYNLATGKGEFGGAAGGSLDEEIMKLTPFGRWQVRLPQGKSNENHGMRFTGTTVDIHLRFWCNAIRINAKDAKSAP